MHAECVRYIKSHINNTIGSILEQVRTIAKITATNKKMTNEIVLYQPDGSVQLEVRVQDESVWLSQQQMAELFATDRTSILRHIRNIYKTHELDESATCAKISQVRQEGDRTISRKIPFYNLDMIISVGYRVNSIRGTRFRQWANKVIKDFMLKGYAVNQRLLNIENQLASQQKQLAKHQEQIDFFVRAELPPAEQIFYNGQFFAARALLEKIIKTAKTRVIVIDAYVDAATFEMLDTRAKGVKADIYSGKNLSTIQKLHNASSGLEPIDTHIWKNASHDRWLIIDSTVYHCGHSLKDMGQKLCAIAQLGVDADDILKKII